MKKHEKALALLERERGNFNLKIWQEKHELSNVGASQMLGLSERQFIKIKNGETKQNRRITFMIKLWGRILRQVEKKDKAEEKLYRKERFEEREESKVNEGFEEIMQMLNADKR